jgi:hypothetical protein
MLATMRVCENSVEPVEQHQSYDMDAVMPRGPISPCSLFLKIVEARSVSAASVRKRIK